MSLLITRLMPLSTNHHSKLIQLHYGYDLLMGFHYLCLLFPSVIFFPLVNVFSYYLLCSPRCDPGFSGPACELASQTFPAFLSEGFSSPRLSSYHSFSSLRGAEVSFGCGVLASGKALVFNRDSRRHLVTAPLDSSQARYMKVSLKSIWGSRTLIMFLWSPILERCLSLLTKLCSEIR